MGTVKYKYMFKTQSYLQTLSVQACSKNVAADIQGMPVNFARKKLTNGVLSSVTDPLNLLSTIMSQVEQCLFAEVKGGAGLPFPE